MATHNTDSWQTTGSGQQSVRFSLIRAEDVRSVFHQKRDRDDIAVIAMVSSPKLDGGASTVLVDHAEGTGEETLPLLPSLFHLDLA
ncbi:hypothetical protein ABZX95_44045 [Streptomyces sp. NPDC004232]|uniref:hypothetical protein n=1 Tax=Streptomyces sp. NPDC004232 TaxID=3154454 RepID=UPI0033AB9F5E